MSGVFDAYAAYYDLLYRDKDYAGEAAYISDLIRHRSPGARHVLELGCGTGAHACQLTNHGYSINGIDNSQAMVDLARGRALQNDKRADLSFSQGDLRTYRDGRSYDVVLSLFHVLSYQTSNEDILAAMATAAAHLRPGGLFIFDCWYGPGVLTTPPQVRVLRLQSDDISVTRIAEPASHPNKNRVDVHYEIIVSSPNETKRFQETHGMRYLFAPEVEHFLHVSGMTLQATNAWMKHEEPNFQTWNACFVASL